MRDRDAGERAGVARRERASAACACARARRSASTVTNALSAGLRVAIRSSSARVSSTLDSALRAQRLRRARRWSLGDHGSRRRSLDDLRHEVQAVLDRRRDAPGSSACWSVSVTTSSRSGSMTSCACAIGSTPVVSTALQLVDHREDRVELARAPRRACAASISMRARWAMRWTSARVDGHGDRRATGAAAAASEPIANAGGRASGRGRGEPRALPRQLSAPNQCRSKAR